jgi:hypothetical protein
MWLGNNVVTSSEGGRGDLFLWLFVYLCLCQGGVRYVCVLCDVAVHEVIARHAHLRSFSPSSDCSTRSPAKSAVHVK